MRNYNLILLLLLTGSTAFAQKPARKISYAQNRIILQCDRYVFVAGDTLWWKASIFSGRHFSATCTNLYAELRTREGKLVNREQFPLINGQSVGQFYLPDTLLHGVYWLKLFTRGQPNGPGGISLVAPITVYQEGDHKMTLMVDASNKPGREISTTVSLNPDTLNVGPGGYNAWRLDINDTTVYHLSCSITDASLPVGSSDPTSESDSLVNYLPDSSYLNWTGKAVKPGTTKKIKGNALMTMLLKDSVLQMSKVLPLQNDGSFRLNSLFFFGKAQLLYQINKTGDMSKVVTMVLDSVPPSDFIVPSCWVSRDTLLNRPMVLPAFAAETPPLSLRLKGRVLKEVKIKSWRSPRKELDSVYTSGPFSEPALYSFDLRNEKYDFGLGDYLRMHLGTDGGNNFSDPPRYPKHPLLFYVNEELKTWDQISDMGISNIAYIKAMESDFIGNDPFTKFVTGVGGFSLSGSGGLGAPSQPTPMIIMIYTRKGKDIKKLPGLNQLTLNGYTPIAMFTPGNNGATLLWSPLIDVNHVRLRFYNDYPAKRFRLTLRGISDSGKEIYYTTVLPQTN